jgi:hypothetical protein
VEELTWLRAASASPPRPLHADQPHESLAGSAETARRADRSEYQPATPAVLLPTADDELQAARAQVEDLKRLLTDAEDTRRKMAAILGGIGIKVW